MRCFRPCLLLCLGFGLLPGESFAQKLLDRLEKRLEGAIKGDSLRPDAAAAATPGYLGLRADDAQEAGRGVRIVEVHAGSPAEASGLRAGDLIVAINGAALTKLDDLSHQLERATVGTKLDFKIEREGKSQVVPVTLGRKGLVNTLPPPRAAETSPPGIPPRDEASVLVREGEASRGASLGITVAPVTDEARQLYRLSVRSGALITAIQPGSPADKTGLPLGGAIVAAEGRRIEQPDDLIGLVTQRHT